VNRFNATTASRAVLIEVANAIGAYRPDFVIIGGWVPELLYPDKGHIGSIDVDLAVSSAIKSGNAYTTILQRLVQAGYVHKTSPTRFLKKVSGVDEPVKVDLVGGQYHGGQIVTSFQIGELQINSLRGVDLAFLASDEMEVSGEMPDGSRNTVRVRVVRPEAFVLIKAFALHERTKDKDAYDISFVLRNYRPAVEALADPLRLLIGDGLGQEGYAILKTKFQSLDAVGPVAAARVAQGQGEDYDQVQRAAFEYAQALFAAVKNLA
jgi:hypothetical protein